MSRFVAWNGLLLSEFFTPASENEDVWLRCTLDELDSFGLHLGGAKGLVDAVSSGAPWLPSGRGNCADHALMLARERRDPLVKPRDYGAPEKWYVGTRPPTYLPILALWVLAASGKHEEGGFYAEVERLLGSPFRGAKLRDNMLLVWQDLQAWTQECAGRLGRFRCRVLGEHRFVGIPRSQCLISRRDEQNIARLFWESRLGGGQDLSDDSLERLRARGREAHFLTKPLRAAMGRDEYKEPLGLLLRKLLLAWDGQQPRTAGAGGAEGSRDQARAVETNGGSKPGVTLALSPSDEVVNGWDVRWSVPALAETAGCELGIGEGLLPATLHRVSACFVTDCSTPTIALAAAALAQSESCRVAVDIRLGDGGDGTWAEQVRQDSIEHVARRILAWSLSDSRYGPQLVEREIPLYGAFYLACGPLDRATTEAWMRREDIAFEAVSPAGLPDGWWMACVLRAEALAPHQRQHLADAPASVDPPLARIRFVGGSPMLRGGTRLFAPYDLPLIEAEGPPGCSVEATGLDLSELDRAPGQVQSGIRHFRVKLREKRGSFEIRILSSQHALAVARLKVADPDGEGLGEARSNSLDKLGVSRPELAGMRGVQLGMQVDVRQDTCPDEQGVLEVGPLPAARPGFVEGSGAAQFLDSLASLGSMSYGNARDQLSRLLDCADPISTLMDLRARGCLEIQTDGKGHFVRVHAAPPTLYGLPATQDGLPLFALGGTPRLKHWTTLLADGDLLPSIQGAAGRHLPAPRVAAVDAAAARSAAASLGLGFVESPARLLADWAGSVVQAREAAAAGGAEFLSAELMHLDRLRADCALFVPTSDPRMPIDRGCGAQLFRFDDPQAPALRLYVLGVRRPDGAARYSHVHDSRWGVWISLLAFGHMLSKDHGRDDAFPWPLHFDPVTRDLWMPARLRPPVVLERALALCSGKGPDVHVLVDGGRAGDRLSLVDYQSGRPIGSASLVYEKFLPGHWLRYRWVPADLATKVASLLACKLSAISQVDAAQGLETLATT